MKTDIAAIRRRAHRGYSRVREALADVRALLSFAVILDRRLSVMQAERLAAGEGSAARAAVGQLAGAESRREWNRRTRREERLRAAVARAEGKRAA